MSVIERRWLVDGTGALGLLGFESENAARLYADDVGVGEVVEYVRADQLAGAVEALHEMRRDLHAVGHPTPLADCAICERWDARIAAIGGQYVASPSSRETGETDGDR